MKFIIGIDLHGTLLDEDWEIKDSLKGELITALEQTRDFCRVYVCSGNDLTFINKYIPQDVRAHFDGCILETGCVVSEGNKEETITPKILITSIKELQKKLERKHFKEVKYFARRLTTISLFTKTEKGGLDPSEFFPRVKKTVKELGFDHLVHVTHSSVAVDIIPKGYNKFKGLKHIDHGLKTIGIADSLNDIDLIIETDYAFVPANASPVLIRELKRKGKDILDLNEATDIKKDVIHQSRHRETEAVVEILNLIDNYLR